MKSKIRKQEELKNLEAKLPSSQITVFTSFARAGEKGLSVAQMMQLKRLLREIQSEYIVTKKTLIDRALDQHIDISKYPEADVYGMDGSLGLVVGRDEPYGIAKKVYEFARKNPALKFFGALLRPASAKASAGKQGSERQALFITKEQFLEMAKMPAREVLIGGLLGMMKYPITSLYLVINEINKQKNG